MGRAFRALLALAIALALALASGCGPKSRERRPDWVIHSRVVFLSADGHTPHEPLPLNTFRLWFPYIIGDLYGAPGTGDFIRPVIRADYSFDIDLNLTEPDLRMSLEPTELSLSYLHILPPEARIARLAPAVLQARGIDPVGVTDWMDADTGERLMLLYADRPARIVGRAVREDQLVQYDLEIAGPGYAWAVTRVVASGTSHSITRAPRHVSLAVTIP
jgi:hypothetical protein